MGVFDLFKKKEDPLLEGNFDLNAGLGLGEHNDVGDQGLSQSEPEQHQGMSSNASMNPSTVNLSTMGFSSMNNMQSQQYAQAQSPGFEKDLQIISLKLDAIKSEIDSINQRVKNIENIAEKEQQSTQQQKRWY
jgi:hypothetical protein